MFFFFLNRISTPEFVDLLNELRRGTISPAALITFKSLSRPLPPSPLSVAPTELFPLRTEVTRSNLARLSALSTPLQTYTSRDSGLAGLEQRKKLLDGMMAVDELRVKEGAQVMLIKNLGEGACTSGNGSLVAGGGLVNGSVGVVLGFWRAGDVWGDSGPGDSKNACGVIRNVKVGADAKTPLIRLKKVGDGEDKENVGPGKTAANDKGKDKPKDTTGELFPLVRFPTAQGSETVLLMREEFRIEDNEGRVLARRMQVCFSFPASRQGIEGLIYFIAIPIHRSHLSLHGRCRSIKARDKLSTGSGWTLGRCSRKVCFLSLMT